MRGRAEAPGPELRYTEASLCHALCSTCGGAIVVCYTPVVFV
jgi:hypothetical protein